MRVLRVCTLVLAVILACTSSPLLAQSPGGLASVMPFSWSPEDWAGSVPSVRPSVRVGYSKMGLNLNFPIPFDFGSLIRPIDLQILDANLWTGAVLLEVDVTSGVRLFFIGQGNSQRNATVIASPDPLFVPFDVEWTGSKVEWWAVEGGLTYSLLNDVNLLIGLRRDHLSIGLTDPRLGVFAIVPTTLDSYSGDIRTKMWIPYFGLELTGANYRVKLVGSPFPWVEARFPFSASDTPPLLLVNPKYALKKSGAFLELDFAYQVQPLSNVGFGIWGNLSWLRARGKGTGDLTTGGFVSGGPLAESATSTLTRYSAGGGLSAELTF